MWNHNWLDSNNRNICPGDNVTYIRDPYTGKYESSKVIGLLDNNRVVIQGTLLSGPKILDSKDVSAW